MQKIFRHPNLSENLKSFPTKIVGTVRQKLSTERPEIMILLPLPPISYPYFFPYQETSETKKGHPYDVFRSGETKKIDKTMMLPSPMHQNVRYWNFFETQKGWSKKFFDPLR